MTDNSKVKKEKEKYTKIKGTVIKQILFEFFMNINTFKFYTQIISLLLHYDLIYIFYI